MNEIIVGAYIPSTQEYDSVWTKNRAFLGQMVSEQAKQNGAYADEEYQGKGFYPLRDKVNDPDKAWFGGHYAARDLDECFTDCAGLCVCTQVIYFPGMNYTKSHNETITADVCDFDGMPVNNKKGGRKISITSSADVVMFGGKKYIWTNKEACESGKDVTMKLWSYNLEDCAKPFDNNGKTNDFGSEEALSLREQCDRTVVEGCSGAEQAMIVKMIMSDADCYRTAKPIFSPKQANLINAIREKCGFSQVTLNVESSTPRRKR